MVLSGTLWWGWFFPVEVVRLFPRLFFECSHPSTAGVCALAGRIGANLPCLSSPLVLSSLTFQFVGFGKVTLVVFNVRGSTYLWLFTLGVWDLSGSVDDMMGANRGRAGNSGLPPLSEPTSGPESPWLVPIPDEVEEREFPETPSHRQNLNFDDFRCSPRTAGLNVYQWLSTFHPQVQWSSWTSSLSVSVAPSIFDLEFGSCTSSLSPLPSLYPVSLSLYKKNYLCKINVHVSMGFFETDVCSPQVTHGIFFIDRSIVCKSRKMLCWFKNIQPLLVLFSKLYTIFVNRPL